MLINKINNIRLEKDLERIKVVLVDNKVVYKKVVDNKVVHNKVVDKKVVDNKVAYNKIVDN